MFFILSDGLYIIPMAKNNQYSESSITVLKGLEPVKERPGMYTRTDSPTHICQEVIDNAADEALGGFATEIDVQIHEDGSLSVRDNGRGIPVGLHPEEGVPVVELVFTRLHAGGKFNKKDGGSAYAFSGGLHGVGVSVTNALSTRLEVTVKREGKVHRIVFSGGDVIEPLTEVGKCAKTAAPKCACGRTANILKVQITAFPNSSDYCAPKLYCCPVYAFP